MQNKTDKKHAKGADIDAGLNEPQTTAQPDALAEELPVPVPLTPEQIGQLKEKAAKADEFRERLLREAADFDNYKKRAARERQDAVTFANENLLQKLIPILDSFEMAVAAASADNASLPALKAGVVMVQSQLKSALGEAGLQEIDARDKPFDPNLHEAVSQQESSGVPEGQVVQQTRKGYTYRNRLLRPAGVIVAKKPSA